MPFGNAALFDYLAPAKRILVAGAGGGCDVYCGIPFFFALRDRGCEVFLANLAFTDLGATNGRRVTPACVEVLPDTAGPSVYFPERVLSRWLALRGEPSAVFAFQRTGVAPIVEAYRALAAELKLDAILLVDGGTDSLMRGDEFRLATPQEDIASIIAAAECPVPLKALACTAMGVDTYHGVCHAHFLRSVAALNESGDGLGVFSMDRQMPEVQAYADAAEDLLRAMPGRESIVNASVLSAIEGKFGDAHRTARTTGSKLWISPLMSLCWAFRLQGVYDRLMYKDQVRTTETYFDLSLAIENFRGALGASRDWEDIPI